LPNGGNRRRPLRGVVGFPVKKEKINSLCP
jgi:hypothetical protein